MSEPRQARCPHCLSTVPSDPERLAFFEYRGPDSRHATALCHCGYLLSVHDDDHPQVLAACAAVGLGKGPRGPHEFDSYYCGCRGWD